MSPGLKHQGMKSSALSGLAYEPGCECERAACVTTIGTRQLEDLVKGLGRKVIHRTRWIMWRREHRGAQAASHTALVLYLQDNHVVCGTDSDRAATLLDDTYVGRTEKREQ